MGNPYFDATSSPIGVLGMNIANSPIPKGDGTFENDVLEQVRVFIQRVSKDEVSGAPVEGYFDIDEVSGVVTLPDLMPLADDSSGGIGIYRDDDTPLGDGVDNDGDGAIDEEYLNNLDDDGDGLIDEDVGDDDGKGRNGVFDLFDDPLPLRNDTGAPLAFRMVPGSTDTVFVDLNLISGSFVMPDDATGIAEGYDYFVVLRTSDQIDYRDTWRVYIEDQGVRFRGGRSAMNTGVSTDSIAANVPVILTDLTRVEPSQQVQTIQANSEPTVVVGLNLYDRTLADRTSGTPQPASLEYIRVTFDNIGGDHDFTPSDLLPISTVEDFYPRGDRIDNDGDGLVDEEILDGLDDDGDGLTDEDCEGNGRFDPDQGEFDWNGDGIPNRGRDSGVALYRDSKLHGKPGVFDPADELVYLDGDEVFGNLYGFPNTIQLNLDRFGDQDGDPYERIPADDLGVNQGNDYFIVIRTSSAVSNGDDFRVRVAPVAANGVVEWPMRFRPRQTNGIFEYTYSYEAVATNVLRANTQTDTVFANLVKVGQKIEANSNPTPVIGVNINDSGNNPPRRMNRVKVRIYAGLPGQADNAASGFDVSDLNAFSNTVNSGLSVYRDVSGEGRNGEFDYMVDQRLNQTVSSYIPYYDGNGNLDYVDAEINLSPGADLPDDDLGENKGLDFFVVVRTSSTISLDDFFTVKIQSNG